eukprot:4127720-Lingulodinium_polyedra.AAC.1
MHYDYSNLFFSFFDVFSHYEYLKNARYRGRNSFRDLRLMCLYLSGTTVKGISSSTTGIGTTTASTRTPGVLGSTRCRTMRMRIACLGRSRIPRYIGSWP